MRRVLAFRACAQALERTQAVFLPAEDGVIALPQTAVTTSLYGDYVYVVQPKEGAEAAEDGQPPLEVRQVFVQPERRSGGLVEVTGLEAGAQVVTAGQNRLSNGQPAIVNNDVNPAADATGQLADLATQRRIAKEAADAAT